MSGFEIPDWAMPPPEPEAPPPPSDPMVAREQQIADATRAEQGLNQFLAAKQAALFEAPDAFYRQQGEDAIHAAPMATQKLEELRNDLLDRLGNDIQRDRLRNALDAQMELTRDGMARHVAEQSHAWQRQVAQDRIALLTKEAALHHNDDGLVDAIGHAAATAARAHGRVGDASPDQEAEDAAAALARSGVLSAAIQARLNRGNSGDAVTMFDQAKDQLDPEHATQLQEQLDGQRLDVEPRPYYPPQNVDESYLMKLPYKPSAYIGPVLRNLSDLPEGESATDQSRGGIVPVNVTPDDAVGAAPDRAVPFSQDGLQGDVQVAKAPPSAPGMPARQNKPAEPAPTPAGKPASQNKATQPLSEEERERRSVANHQELNRLASAPRQPGDINGPLPADWEKRLPKRTLEALDASATRYGVPRRLLAAVLWQESTFDERASEGTPRSGQGLAGLTHDGISDLLNRAVARKDTTREQELRSFDRMNGPQAVNMAAEYLRLMYDENHQSWPAAVLGYKGGRTAAYGWLNGTGEKIKDAKHGGALWATIPPYLRNVFERDPGMYDRKASPDIP